MTTPPTVLPVDDLVALTQASLFNARDLLDDARTLLEAGRIPRAHALAVLAFEEIGKSHLCVLALMPGEMITPESFWDWWRSHPAKLLWAQGVLEMIVREPSSTVSALVERLGSESKATHIRKLAGLYVDYRDGKVRTPGAITAGETRELIDGVAASLGFLLPTWGDTGLASRIKALLGDQGEDLARLVRQVQEAVDADPDAAVSEARRVINSPDR